jgi:hypothetical protein
MTLGLIISVIFGLLSAIGLIYPHFIKNEVVGSSLRSSTLKEEKERLLQILRDLELDHDTNKISDDEFSAMNSQIRRELSQILERISNESESRS